jgi:hypothetical protein
MKLIARIGAGITFHGSLRFDRLVLVRKASTTMKWFKVEHEVSMADENEAHAVAVARKLVPTHDAHDNELSSEAQIENLRDAVEELVFSNPLFMVGGLEVESYSVQEIPPEEIPPEQIIDWPAGLNDSEAAEYLQTQMYKQYVGDQVRKAHLQYQRLRR